MDVQSSSPVYLNSISRGLPVLGSIPLVKLGASKSNSKEIYCHGNMTALPAIALHKAAKWTSLLPALPPRIPYKGELAEAALGVEHYKHLCT